MTPFLKSVASIFYDRYGADVYRLAFVFPNRRAGLFFRKYLSEEAIQPIFSPVIMTISDLFHKFNPKQPVDRIQALFLLYDIYIRQSGSTETFDNFVYWGEMLLNDFDDVDKYLIDPRQLFTNVTDLNRIEKDFSFLTTAQMQAIRSFWASFEPSDHHGEFFLHIWELLFSIYTELRDTLAQKGLASEGMIYREVVEQLRSQNIITANLPYEKIVFVGLNALTNSERELLKFLKQQDIADFYWDYASEMVRDADNKASLFMKDNIEHFPSALPLPEEAPQQTDFEAIGIPSRIGQAKHIYTLLERLKPLDEREALRTAIVLPDEQLLMPVLHSIPPNISRINITIGYPLSGTYVASLMNYLQSLQRNVRQTGDSTLFYHRDVVAVLRHKYVSSVCPDETARLVSEITECNRVYIPVDTLHATPLLQLLFAAQPTASALTDYIINVLKELNARLTDVVNASEQETDAPVDTRALEQEFIFHYYTIVNRLREMLSETRTEMSCDTCFKLLKQMTDLIKIPFLGEPLSGLQVMGVLETRVLDFDNLIILSANEGVFPAASITNSFIPYHLRRGFGLPTPEHRDSIWAYNFYRLIYRARKVYMLYDTRTDGLQSGEASRFIHQLRYHYKAPVEQRLLVYDVSSSRVEPFRISKDEDTARLLAAYETEKSLSASAINTYLDCPLRFYLSVLKGIEDDETVSETLEYDTFGTILHHAMELAYQPLCGKTVTADLLRFVASDKQMTNTIRAAFAQKFFHTEDIRPLVGQAFLYGETIRKYACKILEYDRKLTPFDYMASEKRFHRTLCLTNGRRIRLKGFIDRIDRVKDTVRIVDYKSGKPSALTFDTVGNLFDKTAKDRRKAIMQVFLYAWMYTDDESGRQTPVQPAVYYTRNLFKQNGLSTFDAAIYQVCDKSKTVTDDFGSYRIEFEDALRVCLDELFDVDIPFSQTRDVKHCEYCPHKGICGR